MDEPAFNTATNVKMLADVDDPLFIGDGKLVDNLFTALGESLTAKISEVIGPKPVVFLGTRVWTTLTGSREIEELGAEWGLDGGKITSQVVDIYGHK